MATVSSSSGRLTPVLIGWLFDNHPTEGPGSLTVMRHSRRSDSCLAAYAVSSGLIDLLTDIPAELVAPIVQYKKAILAAEKKVVGVKGMGRWEFWADVKPVNVGWTLIAGWPWAGVDWLTAVRG